jgi:hypothetical protein
MRKDTESHAPSALVMPKPLWTSHTVADQLAAAVGQDRRPIDQTCPLLLVAADGESSHAAAVRGHAGEDRDAAVAGGIRRGAEQSNFR